VTKRHYHQVLYDDTCPLCAFQMRLLQRLDWFGVVKAVPLSDPRAALAAPQLTPEQRLSAIHCITADGKIHRGARCFRFLGMRLPLLALLALVLWIPGAIRVADGVYQWVSRNRYGLSRVFGCKVTPPSR